MIDMEKTVVLEDEDLNKVTGGKSIKANKDKNNSSSEEEKPLPHTPKY